MRPAPSLSGVLFALLVLSSANSHASFLDACAPNGILLDTEMIIGYDFPGTPMVPSTALLATDDVWQMNGPSNLALSALGSVGGSAIPSTTRLPVGGTSFDPIKNVVTGEVLNEFEFGVPIGGPTNDEFRMSVAGNASALGTLDSTGAPADAVLQATAKAEFFNDALPAYSPPFSCAGTIRLPDQRPLAPHENKFEVQILEQIGGTGPVNMIYQHLPGSSAMTVTLTPTSRYEIVMLYEMRVPFGVDPPVDASLIFSVSPPASPPQVPISSWTTLSALLGGLILTLIHALRSKPAREVA